MEKAIKVTAIVSAVIYTIATIFGSILMPMFLAVAYKYYWGDISIPVVLSIFKGCVLITVMIIFMILMIHASSTMSENIAAEVCGLIWFGGLCPLTAFLYRFVNLYITMEYGNDIVVSLSVLNNANSFVAPFVSIAIMLMISAFVTSICRKKELIPVLYDKGLIVSDEDSQV